MLFVLQATPWDIPAERLFVAMADDEALDIKGRANVETKDGTTKGSGLPCEAAVLVWNPAPESKNEEVKLLSEVGKPQKRQVKLEGLKRRH